MGSQIESGKCKESSSRLQVDNCARSTGWMLRVSRVYHKRGSIVFSYEHAYESLLRLISIAEWVSTSCNLGNVRR